MRRQRRLATVVSQASAAPAGDFPAVKFMLSKLDDTNFSVKPRGKERSRRRLSIFAAVAPSPTREEVLETLGMAIYMGAGPSAMYASHALGAFTQFEAAKAASASNG